MHDLSEMLKDPRNANYASTFQIPATAFFNQELIVNGVSVGIIFANISAIERYREQLATVEMVRIDGTYKTRPQVSGDLRYFLTFQILYKSVVSNFFSDIRYYCCQQYNGLNIFFFYNLGISNGLCPFGK